MIMKEDKGAAEGLLVCLSGPSGVGKGTVIEALQQAGLSLDHSVSVTTRAPRAGETEGISYYFRSKNAFLEMLANGEILESDEYCGNYYGTPRGPVEEKLAAGRDIIMDITVPGSMEIIKNFPAAVSIFVLPPSISELRRRLRGRGTESAEVIEKRMAKMKDEVSRAHLFDYIVVNRDLAETVATIRAILMAEKHRSGRQTGTLKEALQE